MRTIFHVDMDAFFVSVEELFDPSLKGKAVVVGGKGDERGVVSAASYEARKFGVHSAMPLRVASRLCPHAIFLEGQMHRYKEYSDRVAEVLDSFTPQLEMASIDEAYLDMTGSRRLWGPPLEAAHKLHEAISAKTGLNCSIGIASSRLVAKIASDQAKRNGVLWVLPGTEAQWLAPLHVKRIPGVGKVTEKQLADLGIKKIGQLSALGARFLEQHFGQWGLALAGKAEGKDAGAWFSGAVGEDDTPKSISHEHTFTEDVTDRQLLHATLVRLTEKVMRRLREHGLHAKTVQLKLRYKDFSTYTRAKTLPEASNIDRDVVDCSTALFHENWPRGEAVRLLGVQVSHFTTQAPQPNLLSGQDTEKWRKVLAATDALKDKYGESTLHLGGALEGRYRDRVHESAPKTPVRPAKPPNPPEDQS
jgi:DNA polymerase IV